MRACSHTSSSGPCCYTPPLKQFWNPTGQSFDWKNGQEIEPEFRARNPATWVSSLHIHENTKFTWFAAILAPHDDQKAVIKSGTVFFFKNLGDVRRRLQRTLPIATRSHHGLTEHRARYRDPVREVPIIHHKRRSVACGHERRHRVSC